jgi:hypothetical protein
MIEKLETKDNRKSFFLIIGLLLIVIFSIRYFLLPYILGENIALNSKTAYKILENLFTSVLVTIGLGSFIFWLSPKNRHNAQIRILQPVDIGNTIVNARIDTEKWFFNGGSGRYTRSQTLPYLAELSRRSNKSIDISILIMDPRNEELCAKYADYKNSLRTAKSKGKKTSKSVQIDLIATIVSCHMWKSEQSSLNITLGLKNTFSLFRTDLSSNGAIITKEDPLEPAIYYEKDTFFYYAQLEELKQTMNQVENLEILPFCGQEEIDEGMIKSLTDQLNLQNLHEQGDLIDILNEVTKLNNPYG